MQASTVDSTVNQFNEFLKIYFSHPAWDSEEQRIRFSFLPSAYLRKRSSDVARPHEWVGAAEASTSWRRIESSAERGFDCYYFVNLLDAAIQGFATNANVRRRLFFAVDLDYRLPVSVEELQDEFGLKAALVVSSSNHLFRKHQLLWGVNDEDPTGILGRKLCSVFGSDPVHDLKRILRVPGTINWKRAEKDANAVSRVELLAGGEYFWDVEEIAERIEKFAAGSLSADLHALGFREQAHGGPLQGERGDYGSWQKAIENASLGKWTVGEGARHNALCSWGVQMAAARLTWQGVEETLRELASRAFQVPYDDEHDFARILAGVRGKYLQIEKEIEDAIPGFDERDVGSSIREVGDKVSPDKIMVLASQSRSNTTPAKNSGETKELPTGSSGNSPKKKRTEQPTLTTYAHRLSKRCDDQTQDEWLAWICRVCIALNLVSAKNAQSVHRLARVIYLRLNRMGLAVGPYFACVVDDVLVPMGEETADSFFSHVLWGLQETIAENKEAIEENETIKARVSADKKFKIRFNLRRAFSSEVTAAILTYAIDNAPVSKVAGRIVARDCVRLVPMNVGAAGEDKEPWSVIEDEKPAPADLPGVSCLPARYRELGAIAVNLLPNGSNATPIFDKFISDSFPDDPGSYELILRMIGYCLLPDNPLQKLFVLEGVPSAGKGILAELIRHLVGPRWSTVTQFSRLASDAGLGPIAHQTVIVIDEAEGLKRDEANTALSNLKRAVAGNLMAVRSLHKDETTVAIGAKFILTCNKPFNFEDDGGGFLRRVVPIHFSTVVDRSGSLGLSKAIYLREGDAIARNAIAALERGWLAGGVFKVSSDALTAGFEGITGATGELRGFLEQIVIKDPGYEVNLSSAFVGFLCELAVSRGTIAKPSGRLAHKIPAELESLGVRYAKDAALPCGLPAGRCYPKCRLDKAALMRLFDLDGQEPLIELIGKASDERMRKFAAYYLELDIIQLNAYSRDRIASDTNF